MEGAKNLEYSAEEPPAVRNVERSEGGDENWRGPPRPRICESGVASAYNRRTGSRAEPGGRRMGPYGSNEGRDNITRQSEGPLLRPCLWEREELVHGRKAQQHP